MLVLPALAEVGPALVQSSYRTLARPHMGTLCAMLGNMPHESLRRGWKNVATYGAEFGERIENKPHNSSGFLPWQLFTCALDALYGPLCSLGRYLEVISKALALQKPFTTSVCSCLGQGLNSALT